MNAETRFISLPRRTSECWTWSKAVSSTYMDVLIQMMTITPVSDTFLAY